MWISVLMKNRPLSALKNIGNTVAMRLNAIGVKDEAGLRQLGAAKAYKKLSKKYSDKSLPVCYYLYSLEGALQNKHWDAFSQAEKLTRKFIHLM